MSENKSKSSSSSNSSRNSANMHANFNAETLDFVKNLWGGMHIPGFNQVSGMSAPTLSAQDLDKKIEDLRAVESWLQMNMSMLRGTIQTLEVQRATIAALQSMSETLASTSKQSGVEKDQADGHAQLSQSVAWWNVLQDQFKSVLSAVAPDASGNHAKKAVVPKPKSAKKSVKTPTKPPIKTPARRTTGKKTVE